MFENSNITLWPTYSFYQLTLFWYDFAYQKQHVLNHCSCFRCAWHQRPCFKKGLTLVFSPGKKTSKNSKSQNMKKDNWAMNKPLGWLFDIEDYTTQLYGDYNKPLVAISRKKSNFPISESRWSFVQPKCRCFYCWFLIASVKTGGQFGGFESWKNRKLVVTFFVSVQKKVLQPLEDHSTLFCCPWIVFVPLPALAKLGNHKRMGWDFNELEACCIFVNEDIEIICWLKTYFQILNIFYSKCIIDASIDTFYPLVN